MGGRGGLRVSRGVGDMNNKWTAGEIETQTENKRMDTKGGSGGVVWDELGDWDIYRSISVSISHLLYPFIY